MRRLLYIVVVLCCASALFAQNRFSRCAPAVLMHSEKVSGVRPAPTITNIPQAAQVTVNGATDVGITGKWYIQTARGGLHNVQVDPSNPNNIHMCAMQALNTQPSDTLDNSYYLNRRV